MGRKEYLDYTRGECGAEEETINYVFSYNLYIEKREYMLRKMDKENDGKYAIDINKLIKKNRRKELMQTDAGKKIRSSFRLSLVVLVHIIPGEFSSFLLLPDTFFARGRKTTIVAGGLALRG